MLHINKNVGDLNICAGAHGSGPAARSDRSSSGMLRRVRHGSPPGPRVKSWAQASRSFAGGRLRMSQPLRSEEHTSELQSLMRISYAVFCLQKKKTPTTYNPLA